ncbi:LysM peptidoglycan-binding domain-containing protein [Metabacillus litoralis]|uniref:LysM peptidoglycan-binding domain-containing protein n=1 Tax=Metabacillus litoralis TaxID=152268 RepID=UPI001CFF1DEC|nr:LysM peptidoglycan-binding domain-containing protein [Metabacillus litoralis]
MKRKNQLIKTVALTLGLTGLFASNVADASTLYKIKEGDTLYNLAKESDITVTELKQLNNLASSTIYTGSYLNIPTTITIKKGDTLYSLAKKYNSTVSQLKHINTISSNTIYTGENLIIPTNVTVKKGDTLYSIARNYGLTVKELQSINYLTSHTIKAGQLLNVSSNKNRVEQPLSYDPSNLDVYVKTKPGFTFDAEEPRRFILQYTKEGSYFSRVEILDSQTNISDIKENSIAYLKGNKITEYPINNKSHIFYQNVEFFLHGSNSKTQTNIVVKKIDHVLIRFTIHYLNKEETEEITPQMIDILQTMKLR